MMLPTEEPRLRIIRHAVDTLGSETALANLLGVTPEEVAHWLSDERTPTDGTYFVVLALLQRSRESAGVGHVGRLDSGSCVGLPTL